MNEGLTEIPHAFLVARDGNTKLHRGVREVYDLSNPALRRWCVDHCVEMAGYNEIDGIFLDGNIKALEPAFLGRELGEEKKQEVAEGYAVMMQDLKNRIPSNKLLLANLIRARLPNSGLDYMQYFDGSYLEGKEMMKSPKRRNASAVLAVGLAILAVQPLRAQTSAEDVTQMEPTWASMAAHYQVPKWFVDGKIGIWTHWGVPSGIDENRPNDGSHYGRRMYGPNEGESGAQLAMTRALSDWHAERYGDPSEFGYEDLVPLFEAEKWDPEALVRFFKDNGARFIMPVACHHDNFDMYDSFHPWNAVDMGPKRDTLREWKDAAHKHGLKFGVSTHLYWSPRFFNTARKYQTPGTLEAKLFSMEYDPKNYSRQDSWNQHWYARCWEIIEKYDPDMFNNDSPYPKISTGKGLGIKLFTDYLNRDLKENDGKQTVVLSFKDGNADRRAFTYNLERGSAADIKPEPWMWATDVSGGWFYRKGAVNRMSIPVMVGNAVDAISKNGVVMLNVALRGDGTLPENQAAYLVAMGDFLRVSGEGIYGTRPWKTFGEGPLKMKDGRQGENHAEFSQADIRFTTREDVLYAFVLAPPTKDIVIKTLAAGGLLDRGIAGIELMGSSETIKWTRSPDALTIQLPRTLPGKLANGFRITTSRDG